MDLDGSSSNAGLLTTTNSFATGTYTLNFVLGGSTRGDTNTIQVSLGDFAQDITLASNAGLTNLSLTFQTTTLPECQAKWMELCTASVDLARTNFETLTQINSRAVDSWIDYVRKSADVTEVKAA